MTILILTAVNVHSHISPPVAMVTDHASSPPPEVSPTVGVTGNVLAKPASGACTLDNGLCYLEMRLQKGGRVNGGLIFCCDIEQHFISETEGGGAHQI